MQSLLHSAAQAPILAQLAALAQVLFIDLVLAGDNAVVVGLAVAGLAASQKRRAALFGIAIAALIRLGLASVALKLLAVVGLTLAGGLLLLWVCWRMYRELRPHRQRAVRTAPKSLGAAVLQITLADLSMSLDNILAVAGAAEGHPAMLLGGVAISVVLMAVAATVLARLLERFRWLAWAGLLMVLFVACKLIWQGGADVWLHLPGLDAGWRALITRIWQASSR